MQTFTHSVIQRFTHVSRVIRTYSGGLSPILFRESDGRRHSVGAKSKVKVHESACTYWQQSSVQSRWGCCKIACTIVCKVNRCSNNELKPLLTQASHVGKGIKHRPHLQEYRKASQRWGRSSAVPSSKTPTNASQHDLQAERFLLIYYASPTCNYFLACSHLKLPNNM